MRGMSKKLRRKSSAKKNNYQPVPGVTSVTQYLAQHVGITMNELKALSGVRDKYAEPIQVLTINSKIV